MLYSTGVFEHDDDMSWGLFAVGVDAAAADRGFYLRFVVDDLVGYGQNIACRRQDIAVPANGLAAGGERASLGPHVA